MTHIRLQGGALYHGLILPRHLTYCSDSRANLRRCWRKNRGQTILPRSGLRVPCQCHALRGHTRPRLPSTQLRSAASKTNRSALSGSRSGRLAAPPSRGAQQTPYLHLVGMRHNPLRDSTRRRGVTRVRSNSLTGPLLRRLLNQRAYETGQAAQSRTGSGELS